MAGGALRRRRAPTIVATTVAFGIWIVAMQACGSAPTTSPREASPTATPHSTSTPAASSGIQVRQLVQQALAIGLASSVLQSQLAIVEGVLDGRATGACSELTPSGAGSSELISKTTAGQQTTADLTIYYDASCADPYIRASAVVTTSATASTLISITDQSDYVGPSGVALGTLTLNESIAGSSNAGGSLQLFGTGLFTPANGAPTVSLGLTCDVPESNGTPPPFPCSGAIAQSFPDQGMSLGSVTTLMLTLTAAGNDQYTVALASSAATLDTGSTGALSVSVPTPTTPVISGAGPVTGSDVISGGAGSFSLFPPTPTGWSATDQAEGMSLSLQLNDNTTGDLAGHVTTTGGVQLAELTLDRSGTGSLTYSGGAHTAVTNWTLAG